MAALTTTASKPSTIVRGLANSSLHGRPLPRASHRIAMPFTSNSRKRSAGLAVAKYGEKSIYFDLEDISNTTGAWDLYGSDGPSPYNPLQSKFFEVFAAPFTKRGLLLKFLILVGGGAVAYAGANAPDDILPIKKGPQKPPTPGPQGKI